MEWRGPKSTGAVADYTATLGILETQADVRAMVLFNRALAHVALGDDGQATDDLGAVLAMNASPPDVKTMAKQQKLVRMESRSRKSGAAGSFNTPQTQGG